jgi:pimeloyl-ACP methyl ester carboxylesterase
VGGLYRTADGRQALRTWCQDRLDRWSVEHRRLAVETVAGPVHVVQAGDGPTGVVYLPGTHFNAATSLRLLGALAARCRVSAVDLPGQPGLSSELRLPDTPEAQRPWLRQVLARLSQDGGPLILLGHSRGAQVALAADPETVDGLVLVNPAGLVRATVGPRTLRFALPWLLRPTPARSAALLRMMTGPAASSAQEPADRVTDHAGWLTAVARSCRPTGAPPPVPREVTDRWRSTPHRVLVGADDCFFPPHRVVPAVRARLDSEPVVLPGVGHLAVEEATAAVVESALELGR